ncbi:MULTISPECIES: ABC-2 transporter permease [Bifidobacterium]|uniref:Uncharacterized protein n=1 Tax=Bifidobacterium asteroides TaxID=1684 RepID=A0A556RBX2_9BIFI|nr:MULTISPECIES: ABC-2 transporter permease [Bifidobacterium]MBI0086167.1 ABC-2 transporter permease [Bifidobacterium sp. M0404]TSJ86390.1 hypothetical protein FPK29_01495 [Bifidobacterium polysaccharolyticum]
MKAIAKQIRLDLQRCSGGTGGYWPGVLLLIAAPLVGIVLKGVLVVTGHNQDGNIDSLSGLVTGFCVADAAAMQIQLFIDFSSSASRLNGIVPISRDHQVLGRYSAVALLVLAQCCCFVIYFRIAGSQPWKGSDPWQAATLFTLAIFVFEMLLFALVAPLFYWLDPVKARRALLVLFALIALVGIVLAWLPLGWGTLMTKLGRFLIGDLWKPVVLGLAIVLLANLISAGVSSRVYARREID